MVGDGDGGDGGAGGPDLARAPLDLAGVDLNNLTNCFERTLCDSGNQLCIQYLSGTQAAPGPATAAPACYQPDACPNNVYNCACITADPGLGPNCKKCVDNGNRTFTCYANP